MVDFEDIQINLENNQGLDNNFDFFNNNEETPTKGGNINAQNPYNNFDYSNYGQQNNIMESNAYGNIVDPEELKRQEARKKDELELGDKIRKKISDELQAKQEFRDKARNFLDNFSSLRTKNLATKHNYNLNNENEFLKNRKFEKEGKNNPWERVVENIALKDSDNKGTKDVTRMKNVIITRKNDFVQLKLR